MATIIASRFQQQTQVQEVISELLRNGFQQRHVSSFYVNPAGQHDLHPLGGDHAESPGAHAGSLPGTLSHAEEGEEIPVERHAGMLVAVEVAGAADEAQAIAVFRMFGGCDIERADGSIDDGDWSDFDPLGVPVLVDQAHEHRA